MFEIIAVVLLSIWQKINIVAHYHIFHYFAGNTCKSEEIQLLFTAIDGLLAYVCLYLKRGN